MEIYQVDAFTTKVFAGNPAAVVPLEYWIDDSDLQAIAAENNLAETAFSVPSDERWELRWFTPTAEVALCGHDPLWNAIKKMQLAKYSALRLNLFYLGATLRTSLTMLLFLGRKKVFLL